MQLLERNEQLKELHSQRFAFWKINALERMSRGELEQCGHKENLGFIGIPETVAERVTAD